MTVARFFALSLLTVLLPSCGGEAPTQEAAPTQEVVKEAKKIPITSSSEEAVEVYLQARGLLDRLRIEESHRLFEQAVELDPEFALAHLGLANSTAAVEEYFTSLQKAADLAEEHASQAEVWMIHGQLFGANGNSTAELDYYTRLAEAYPDDERAHDLLGTFYYALQDFEAAAEHSRRATEIAPEFSSPWNNLGYSYLSMGRYEEAEAAFRENLKLIPDEPNPHDSLAELLLKMGRYDESIAEYRESLRINPSFWASQVGIGHNQIFQGELGLARASFESLLEPSVEESNRRQGLLGLASVDLVEGNVEAAEKRLWEIHEMAVASTDPMDVAGTLVQLGDFHLAREDFERARSAYQQAAERTEEAKVGDFVKDARRTRGLVRDAQLAILAGDLEKARSLHDEHLAKVSILQEPGPMRQSHQLAAEIAIAEEDWESAIENLSKADPSLPRVDYLAARAHAEVGDVEVARQFVQQILTRNEPLYGYAEYWEQAKQLAEELGPGA